MFSSNFLRSIRKYGKVTTANENKGSVINKDTRVFSDIMLNKQ